MKKIVYSLFLLWGMGLYSQQEPQYTQYVYNPSVINPAYAGSLGYGSVFSLYRAQWLGLEGAPKTINLSYNQPLENTNLGVGLNVVHDIIGPSATSIASVDVSYTINFANDHRLAFGVKAAGQMLNIDYTKLNHFSPSDVSFKNNISNQFSPNVGVGLFYYNETSYFGVSVPMLLQTKRYDEFASSDANSRQHLYVMGGKVFDLTYNVKFKPAFVAKLVVGAPLQLDFTANFLINEKFTAGLSYRWSAAVSAIVGFKISESFAIGYGYDRETTRLANFNSGSHELFLQFDLFKITQQIETPRFF
jgi:type IX secretion system PorP/SprF family membrane protein